MAIKSRWSRYLMIALLLLIAWSCRFYPPHSSLRWWFSLLRSGIYTGLFLIWGFNLYYRVTQIHARRYLIAIAGLMVFWMIIRTVKFLFAVTPSTQRFLWYLYYLPQIFIPLMAVMAAFFLGKSESWKINWWTFLLYFPAGFLLLLVLSNDRHQLVFSFLFNINQFDNGQYHHEPGYYLILAWIVCCVIIVFYLMITRCRAPDSGRRIWMPLLCVYALIIYGIAYLLSWPWLYYISTDMTVVCCLFIVLIFETCFSSGLIQTNTHYMELFTQLKAPAALLNERGEVELSSHTMNSLNSADRSLPSSHSLGPGMILKQMPIHGGSIAWVEDVAVLEELKSELEEKAHQLAEEKDLLEAEVNLKEKKTIMETRTRLYDMASNDLSGSFFRLNELVQSLTLHPERQKKTLACMCVIGAYIKRRCNMLILQEEQDRLSVDVLYHALRESCDYIQLCGIDCHLQFKGNGEIELKYMKEIYDRFEKVVDACLNSLEAILVMVQLQKDRLVLKIQAEVSDKVILQEDAFDVEQEDELLTISSSIPVGPGVSVFVEAGEPA